MNITRRPESSGRRALRIYFAYSLVMYAIYSLLRRLAATVIYAEPGRPLQLPSDHLAFCVSKGQWSRARVLKIYQLEARASSSAKAAQDLSRKENELAESMGAKERRYTLILGPEEEVTEGQDVIRRTRIAAINGIFRYRSGVVERLQTRRPSGRAVKPRRRKRRLGVLRERR